MAFTIRQTGAQARHLVRDGWAQCRLPWLSDLNRIESFQEMQCRFILLGFSPSNLTVSVPTDCLPQQFILFEGQRVGLALPPYCWACLQCLQSDCDHGFLNHAIRWLHHHIILPFNLPFRAPCIRFKRWCLQGSSCCYL